VSWGSDGPYFEDFGIDVTYKHWPGRTITQEDNALWCTLSMDFTPLYLDEEYARLTEHKRCVVNPRLVRAVVVGICVKDTTRNAVANLGTEYEKLLLPVFPGDSLYAQSTVVSKRESQSRPYAGIVAWIHEGFNQKGEKIYESKRSNLVYKTNSSPWAKMLHNGDGK
jgi:acyl dehydratase